MKRIIATYPLIAATVLLSYSCSYDPDKPIYIIKEVRPDGSTIKVGPKPGNGTDDDYDGKTEEGPCRLGEKCSVGEGACEVEGVYVCSDSGVGDICDAIPLTPSPELCGNELDDDCDGETDEGFEQIDRECTMGEGECAASGKIVCSGDRLGTECDAIPGKPGDELCGNSLDDDCDGETDEGFNQIDEDCTTGEGACVALGRFVCSDDLLSEECDAIPGTPIVEVCGNEIDDDCDGETDEGFELAFDPNNCGQCGDSCYFSNALAACVDGECRVAGCDSQFKDADGEVENGCECEIENEVCDGVDNNCDGLIDNAIEGTGLPCDGPDDDEEPNDGIWICNGIQIVCIPTGELGPEKCDGIDNNGDLRIDDGFDLLGEDCTVGLGVCKASGKYVCASSGAGEECSAQPGTPSPELCDNDQDDDCDGETDEGFANLGNTCSVGQGACRGTGRYVCAADGLRAECNATAGAPTAELCGNNQDDDCDGQTDEGFTNVGTSCSVGQGACRGTGQYVCAADGLRAECNATAGAPTAELCGNDQDDDCDGQTDEGFANLGSTCSVGQGACRGTGRYVCAADGLRAECNATTGSPTAELCGNDVDDDCDGQTDEGFTNLGTSCSVGQGACRGTGQYVCAADGLRAECNATAGSPTAELCGNDVDDDCDGQTDEGFTNIGTSCSIGQGACRATGQYVCAADGLRAECNAIAGVPTAERCGNNQDDDCDGQTDEGFTNIGTSCSIGQGACRGTGQYVCAADGLREECNAIVGAPAAELCGNNQDDDCDGQTDEGFTNLGNTCSVGQGACRGTGQYVCAVDGLRAECNATAGSPTAERCGNNQDDDCDGQTDEGFTNLGTSCSIGQGVCRVTGQYVCAADGLRAECNATAGSPTAERCGNNQDDDCDGQTDEGFTNLGTSCSVGQGACRRTGQYVCAADGLRGECNATAGTPIAELCGNNQDDDCDNQTDEGFDLGGACSVGTGECNAEGNMVCSEDGTSTVCSAEPGTPVEETCTGYDDDCDGFIDYRINPETGIPESVCSCDYFDFPIVLDGPGNTYQGSNLCEDTTCQIDSDGVLTMDVCHICSSPYPWSTCIFAKNQDFSIFDANAQAEGIVEIRYCIDQPIDGVVAVWYGADYRRKQFILSSPGESPGCYTRYFEPEDACFGEIGGLSSQCWDLCGYISNGNCLFQYGNSNIMLTVSACEGSYAGTVRLLSVTYLEDSCRCSDDTSCDTGTRTECTTVQPGLGLCTESDCEGRGDPCTTTVDGSVCNTSLTCLGDQAVCPTTGCE